MFSEELPIILGDCVDDLPFTELQSRIKDVDERLEGFKACLGKLGNVPLRSCAGIAFALLLYLYIVSFLRLAGKLSDEGRKRPPATTHRWRLLRRSLFQHQLTLRVADKLSVNRITVMNLADQFDNLTRTTNAV